MLTTLFLNELFRIGNLRKFSPPVRIHLDARLIEYSILDIIPRRVDYMYCVFRKSVLVKIRFVLQVFYRGIENYWKCCHISLRSSGVYQESKEFYHIHTITKLHIEYVARHPNIRTFEFVIWETFIVTLYGLITK